MRIVVAMDSFKGSLTSLQAGNGVKDGILQIDKNTEIAVFPLADGGEGTVQALHSALGGEWVKNGFPDLWVIRFGPVTAFCPMAPL